MSISPNATTNISSSGNTWNKDGVTWIATASNLYSGTALTASSAFNDTTYMGYYNVGIIGPNIGSYNATSPFAYGSQTKGTNVSGSTIYGEWVQIQSNIPLLLNSYSFYTRNNYPNINKNFIGLLPKIYTIVGSNDGSTWSKIQDGDITSSPGVSAAFNNSQATSTYTITTSGTAKQANNNDLTGYPTASNTYTYFRIIVTNLIGTGTYGATSEGLDTHKILQFGWTPTFISTTITPIATQNITLSLVTNTVTIPSSISNSTGTLSYYLSTSFGTTSSIASITTSGLNGIVSIKGTGTINTYVTQAASSEYAALTTPTLAGTINVLAVPTIRKAATQTVIFL